MATNEEVNADRAESESLDSSSTESPIPYNRPVARDSAATVVDIPTWERVDRLMNRRNDGRYRCSFTAHDMLADFEYNIRWRITKCASFNGKGAKMYHPRVAMFWARKLLISLWHIKGDMSVKNTMTHKEIYKSNIGRTLTAFKTLVQTEIEHFKKRIKQLSKISKTVNDVNYNTYDRIIYGYKQSVEDIDNISKLLVEFANENNGWNIEDLGLPEYKHNDEDGDNEDGEDSDNGDYARDEYQAEIGNLPHLHR